MKGPVLTLINGVDMPALGLGVYQSCPEETVEPVKAAPADRARALGDFEIGPCQPHP